MIRRPPRSTLFPTRRSSDLREPGEPHDVPAPPPALQRQQPEQQRHEQQEEQEERRLERHRRRSEEHTSELQSQFHLVCRLLLEKKNKKQWPICMSFTSVRSS